MAKGAANPDVAVGQKKKKQACKKKECEKGLVGTPFPIPEIPQIIQVIQATANAVFESTNAVEVKVEYGGIAATMRRKKGKCKKNE